MIYIVNRIENDIAVLEDEKKNITEMPLSKFDFKIKENMALKLMDDGSFKRNESYEKERLKRIKKLMDDLWE